MECPACGHDRYEVFNSPRRFQNHDLRDAQCQRCRRQFVLITTIKAVHVINPSTLASDEVPLEKFSEPMRQYCLGRGPHPNGAM